MYFCIIKLTILKVTIMAKLLKTYPNNPIADREVYRGSLDDMLYFLNDFENRITLNQVGKDGGSFTDATRLDLYTLHTHYYNLLDPHTEPLEIIYKVTQ